MRITVLCADLGIRVPGDTGASIHLQAITRALAGVGRLWATCPLLNRAMARRRVGPLSQVASPH